MKIAVCSPISLTNFSGAAKFLIEAAKVMDEHGHEVEVYASPLGPNRNLSLEKVKKMLSPVSYHETEHIKVEAEIAYVNYAPFVWRRMHVKGAKIAGLHTHLLLPEQHLKQTLAHPFEAGYEWFAKTTAFAFLLPLLKMDLYSFDAAHIPLGDFSIRGTKLYKIPLWIDLKKIPRENLTKFDKFTVLFAGRKTWEKGWNTFCKTCSLLRQKGQDFAFMCTGEGKEGVQGLGFLPENELYRVYQRSHVVVYPSIADVFGLVILEAAACGTPVVTTPIKVHVDQNLPLHYGENPHEFAEAILNINALWRENPHEYNKLSEKLLKSAEEYDVKRVFPLFEKMLRDIAE
ncbi:MAG: glycosyltransferase [Candidatus Bathyarchaeia archaeon]